MKRRPSFWEVVIALQVLTLFSLASYLVWRQTTTALIYTLRTGDAESRSAAARDLGSKGPAGRDAIPVLIEALQDPNDSVQTAAAWALFQIGGMPALAQAVKSPDDAVRMRVMEVLRSVYSRGPAEREQKLKIFMDALSDRSNLVREYAVEGLQNLGKPDALSAEPALIRLIHDPEPRVRSVAATALISLGSADGLAAILFSADWNVRYIGINGLEKLGPEAVPQLTEALNDPNGSIVRRAADILGGMGPRASAALPALTNVLSNPDASARGSAVNALERIEGVEAIPAIRQVVNDPDRNVRAWAEQALARLDRLPRK